MRSLFFLAPFLLCVALLSGCCTSTTHRSVPPTANVTLSGDDARVGSYVSSWNGFRTSSYWIEGPDGLILIDTQFLLSAAEEMVDWAEKVTGKKAKLAIVLHPNPDKFNGTALFQKRGIRVITSEQVARLIPSVHKLRLGWFYDRFKPDYPLELPKPESFGSSSREISAAGITVKLHILGAGCSDAHVVVQYEKHLFVGDLITQGFHSWLELGHLNEWLDRLDEIRAMKAEFIHTGRGGSGSTDLIDREETYLESVIDIVKAHHPKRGVALTDKISNQILSEIEDRYPLLDYSLFVSNGLAEVWKQLSY